MSQITMSQRTVKPREKSTLFTRVLNRCISLLPYLRLPGYCPTPSWDLVDPRPEEARAKADVPATGADQGKPRFGPHERSLLKGLLHIRQFHR